MHPLLPWFMLIFLCAIPILLLSRGGSRRDGGEGGFWTGFDGGSGDSCGGDGGGDGGRGSD